MHLIRASTKELVFFISSQAPPYVILSHTWGPEEILFADFVDGKLSAKGERKADSFKKFQYTCAETVRMEVEYCWIDNCCIDKNNSAELVAPTCVYFFDSSWNFWGLLKKYDGSYYGRYGDEYFYAHVIDDDFDSEFNDIISHITRVPKDLLSGYMPLQQYSVAQRMSWAADRETTVPEDTAYYLLGIFQIAMSMLYGEGQESSFERLQKKLLKRSTDETIFAWRHTSPSIPRPKGFLANHPFEFKYSASIEQVMWNPSFPNWNQRPYSMTNLGLQIEAALLDVPAFRKPHMAKNVKIMLLGCMSKNYCSAQPIGILVRRSGVDTYHRLNVAQIFCASSWASPRRIIITETPVFGNKVRPDVAFPVMACSLSEAKGDYETRRAMPVWMSHNPSAGNESLDKEMNQWSNIGWTKEKSNLGSSKDGKLHPACVQLDVHFTMRNLTIWIGTEETYQFDKGHTMHPKKLGSKRPSPEMWNGHDDKYLGNLEVDVTYSGTNDADNQNKIYFVRAVSK